VLKDVTFAEVRDPDGRLSTVCFISYGDCNKKLAEIKDIACEDE
jgi:hypothetical protein